MACFPEHSIQIKKCKKVANDHEVGQWTMQIPRQRDTLVRYMWSSTSKTRHTLTKLCCIRSVQKHVPCRKMHSSTKVTASESRSALRWMCVMSWHKRGTEMQQHRSCSSQRYRRRTGDSPCEFSIIYNLYAECRDGGGVFQECSADHGSKLSMAAPVRNLMSVRVLRTVNTCEFQRPARIQLLEAPQEPNETGQ